MRIDYRDVVSRVNCLTNDLNALYHKAARILGVADSVLIVMYMIHDKGNGCLLYDIWNESGVSKQTVNSAIRNLEERKILYLKQEKGRNKRVFLTDLGKTFMEQTAALLYEAECNAFIDWTDEEFTSYISLMEKYNRSFGMEIDKLKGAE